MGSGTSLDRCLPSEKPKDSCITPPPGAYNDLPLLGSWQRMTLDFPWALAWNRVAPEERYGCENDRRTGRRACAGPWWDNRYCLRTAEAAFGIPTTLCPEIQNKTAYNRGSNATSRILGGATQGPQGGAALGVASERLS